MEHIDNIISQIISNFDFAYVIIINILTYLIIVLFDLLNKDKKVSTWEKRIILLICIFIISGIYILTGYNEYIKMLNSAILAPVFWGWIIKPIFKKLNIDYKHLRETMDNEYE